MKNIKLIGVHVRSTDYIGYLKGKYIASPVKPDYFLRQMNVLSNKYKPVMFVVVSDNHEWCECELHGDDNVVMRNNSPGQDLAIMAACNHSIIDYVTYRVCGTILAGRDALLYNIRNGPAFEMASLLPN
jgi:galactoside 2-L-fucosyltransferase 1/2